MAKPAKAKLPQDPNGIFNYWLAAARESLGDKSFERRAVERLGPRLRTAIRKRLKKGPFTAADARNTRQLARMLGRICRISTDSKTVTLDTVQKVFQIVKDHPRCPAGGGQGEWCSIH
jgi:hypothetical protein